LIVPGSVFGFVVTSWDDVFFGIRNDEVILVVGGGANGLFVIPADGLVSLAARRGGDVTCGLFVFAPDGIERARCFSTSLTEGGIPVGAVAAVAVAITVDDVDDVVVWSCPG
jgi:hypothetical protein